MSNPPPSLAYGLLGGLAFAALAACSPPFNHQAYVVESARATVMAKSFLFSPCGSP
jgi:hypothetical protein